MRAAIFAVALVIPLFLHNDYFLTESVDDIYRLGERIFAKTDAQMTEIAHRIDPHARGWPEIPFDGHLLVSQQDALLMGRSGKDRADVRYSEQPLT